jgi:probable HAF family extracellular repeat protein
MFAMAVFGGVGTAFADTSYSFITIDVPGANDTFASGINDNGQIVGGFLDANENYHGFLVTGGSLTTFNVPGLPTVAYGINNSGQIVGYDGQGFLDTDGSFTTITVPVPNYSTSAYGINNKGQIMGWYSEYSSGMSHGFLDTGGSFTTIDVPGATYTQAYGINDSGQIVGVYGGRTGRPHGFLDTAGSFITINGPHDTYTQANGINNSGQIVGTYSNNFNNVAHGFLYTNGSLTTFDVPGLGAPSPLGSTTAARSWEGSWTRMGRCMVFSRRPQSFPEPR